MKKPYATIANNDPSGPRVELYIVHDPADADHRGNAYAIRTGTGEDAGGYRWRTIADAQDAVAHLWGAPVWDLRIEP